MSDDKYLDEVVQYWIEKAEDSLKAAKDELAAGRLSFSVNRIYYGCFYIVSAFLLRRKFRFSKHSGVRGTFHQQLVKPGLVSRENGQLYDELFEARQRGDYVELVTFEKENVKDWLERALRFIKEMTVLIKSEP